MAKAKSQNQPAVKEIIGKFGGVGQLRKAVLYRQTGFGNHLRRTRNRLLPRLPLGQVNHLKTTT